MQPFNPHNSCSAGAADTKQTRVNSTAKLFFPDTQLSYVLGKDVLKLQYFTEADLNRYVRILLLTSNQIGVQVWKSILFIRYLSNRTEETDEDCKDLRRRLEDYYPLGDNGLGEGPAASTSKLTITCIPVSLVCRFQGMSALVKITMELHCRYFFGKLHCDQLELIGAGT